MRVWIKNTNVAFLKYLKNGGSNANYTNLQASQVELTGTISL